MDPDRLKALRRRLRWVPQPGPQLEAWNSTADQLLFGGAAGGGKSSLAAGLATVGPHRQVLIVRRQGTELVALVDEIAGIVGSRDGLNASTGIWRLPDRVLRLGGVPNPGDEAKYQGAARDLLVVDECCALLESQVRFLLGWSRSTVAGQRVRALFCTNPPSSAEGEWVVRWFSPWLDPSYPVPAKPGELRWVAMIPGEGERWVDGPYSFPHKREMIRPISRTFIPSRIGDNRYLAETDYMRQLQALPEPLRSQMLMGDFSAGRSDDEWQVIPSALVKAAMARWKPGAPAGEITAVGVDPSRGGDETIIAVRRGWRFDELVAVPAAMAAHGGNVAKKVMDVAGEVAPVHIDVIGIGASVYDHLEAYIGRRAVAVNAAGSSSERDLSGYLGYANQRAATWWRLRELLQPERGLKVSLPPDQRLFADLTAPRYRVTARGIQVEDKMDIKRRLGRSPDRGDAVVLAAIRSVPIIDLNAERGRMGVILPFGGWN